MDSTSASTNLTVESLNNTALTSEKCKSIIDSIIKSIDTEIIKFPVTVGRNIMPYVLPIEFGFQYDDTDDKRRNRQYLIYGNIIKNLEERGFTIRINIGDRKNILYVIWDSTHEQKELAAMQKLIKSRLVHDTND